jgi:1-aminocyclopropane-1-carboxylate deaminase/D-cysteine desulfhydrase-like pyridoxal-dependent ACC family enzyme
MWQELETRLSEFPKYPLAAVPTPLQSARRLSKALGGPTIFVKRDDLTGLAFGGNKVRQMEYFIGEAAARAADVFIGGGGFAQSNHARVCSAAARAAGMLPVIIVRPGGPEVGLAGSMRSGNALITRALCDDIRTVPELAMAPRERLAEVEARRDVFEAVACEYRARGHRPYSLVGSSVALGALGYVGAALELEKQFQTMRIRPSWIVVTSLGVTQAGLELGSRLLGASWRVYGVAYMPTQGKGNETVARLTNEAAELLRVDVQVSPDDVLNVDAVAGPAYGVPSDASQHASELAAVTEGLLLDPVYSSKGLAGLQAGIELGQFTGEDTIVFVHTGGQPSLFA